MLMHSKGLTVAFALWGLAVAISLAPVLTRPAPPDQLPGYAKTINLDASSPLRVFAAVVVLPILFAILSRPIVRRLVDAERWAANAVTLLCAAALWLAPINSDVFWVGSVTGLAIAVCVLARKIPARFTRHDAILLPATMTLYLAIHDIARALPNERAFYLAALIVLMIRIAVVLVPSPALPAYAFLAAPLGLALQTPFFARDQRYNGWPALILVIVTSWILRALLRNERRASTLLAFVVYPIAVYSYTTAIALDTAEGKHRVSFFEVSHSLLPASQMLRGERLYRDVLPTHGMIEDGLLDYLALRFDGETAGDVMHARYIVSCLKTIALYALTAAATGSIDAGIVTVFLSLATGRGGTGIRGVPAIATLAFLVAAVRKRNPRYFVPAATFSVLSGLTSVEFGAYTFLALSFAVIRFPDRRQAAKYAAVGLAATGFLALILLASFGIAGSFFTSTFGEILTLGPAYALDTFTAPAAMKRVSTFPDVLAAIFDGTSFPYLIWFGVLIFLAISLARSPLRGSRRTEPFVLIAFWIVIVAISYAERHHLYFQLEMIALLVCTAFVLVRRRSPLAFLFILFLVVLAQPNTHIAITGWLRHTRGPIDQNWTEIPEIPRARGALFATSDAEFVREAKRYFDRLPPEQTFFDFTNRGALYFLFDRDAPIRQPEVAFYEREDLQREVIRRLEQNANVRVALISQIPHDSGTVDHIPNSVRAPLVWKWLQENFVPDHQVGTAEFWRRK